MTISSPLKLMPETQRAQLVKLAKGPAHEPWHKAVHLLSDDDLAEIGRYGVPCGPRPDLVALEGDRLVFTEMGRQYYGHSLLSHGVEVELGSVGSKAALIELHAEIFGAVRRKVRSQLHTEFEAGRVEPRDREIVEARLFGTIADMARALRRHLQFSGQNVIPVAFKKKRRS